MKWYKDKIFWVIVSVSAVIKTAFFGYLYFAGPLGEQILVFPDSLGYVYPAQTLLAYGHLWEAVSATPMLLRTPGYPLFLAFVQFTSGNITWAVAAAQNILSVCMLLPVYLTARRLGGIFTARWAAGFCAVSVLYFSLAFAVLTETLCAFLLAWFVFLALRWLNNPRPHDLIGAALLLAASTYVRPVVYYFIPVVLGLLLWQSARQKSRALMKQSLLYFALPLVFLIGTWQVRNYVQTGYGGFTSVGAYNLYIWNEDFVARQRRISVAQAHELLEKSLPTNFYNFPAKKQVETYKQLARPLLKQSWTYKLSHVPLWSAKTLLGTNHVHLSRLILAQEDEPEKTLNQTGALPLAWLTTNAGKLLFGIAFLQVATVVMLGLWGLWLGRKKYPVPMLFLAVYIGYFWALGSGFLGAYARLRAPFEFVLCITAAVAVNALWARRKKYTPLP